MEGQAPENIQQPIREHTPEFIVKKYNDLPGSKEVQRAVRLDKHRQMVLPKNERTPPKNNSERLGIYFTNIQDIINKEYPKGEGRGLEWIKKRIYKSAIVSESDDETITKLANDLYEEQVKIATERGQKLEIQNLSEAQISAEYKPEVIEKLQTQKKSLESWLDYLSSSEATYPMWFKYYASRSLLKMGKLDKAKRTYPDRSKNTLLPFPELNYEALANVYNQLVKHSKLPNNDTGIVDTQINQDNQIQIDPKLEQLLEKADFSSLYASAQLEVINREMPEGIDGEWVKYDKGSDHMNLYSAIHNKGTGWCTAGGEETAKSQVDGGDFYVYYSYDKTGTASLPRIAIRMEGNKLAEVRGVNPGQELEPDLLDIAQEKYHTLPGGEKFDKKTADMKRMTTIVKKQEAGQEFTQEDVIFLYEFENKIEGFGHSKDPRVWEVLEKRNAVEDFEKIDRKYLTPAIDIVINKISSGKFIENNLEKALGFIECNGTEENVLELASKIDFRQFSKNNTDRILSFVESRGDSSAASNLGLAIGKVQFSEKNLDRIVTFVEYKGGNGCVDNLIEATSKRIFSEKSMEKVINFVKNNGKAEQMTLLASKIPLGGLSDAGINAVLSFVENCGDCQAVDGLSNAISNGQLSGNNLERALKFIENNAIEENISGFISSVSRAILTKEQLDRTLTLLESKGGSSAAGYLQPIFYKNKLTEEHLDRIFTFIESKGDSNAANNLAYLFMNENLGRHNLSNNNLNRAFDLIETKGDADAADKFTYVITEGNLSKNYLERVFKYIETKGDARSIHYLSSAIGNGELTDGYIDRSLDFIEKNINTKFSGNLAGALSSGRLIGDNFDRALNLIEANLDNDVPRNIIGALSYEKITEENFERVFAIIKPNVKEVNEVLQFLSDEVSKGKLTGEHFNKVFALIEDNGDKYTAEELVRKFNPKKYQGDSLGRVLNFIFEKDDGKAAIRLIDLVRYDELSGENLENLIKFIRNKGSESLISSLDSILKDREKKENSFTNKTKRFFNNVFNLQKTA
jgi:hypothetical protein